MIKVKSTVRINTQKIKRLDTAAVMALKLTADLLKTEITDKDVIPRDRGTLEDSLFVDDSQADQGRVSLNYYIGRMDGRKEKSIGIYQRGSSPQRICIGSPSSYQVKQISVKIH